ncbi:Hypothetical predicted protein [Cloeon dipterum]|uniref:Uncharacterized protein n=1 Tax=Cloeon dipterum TaxID=197152 RepID=A0A8S1D7X6_9INSE|nr:Hypothetical predicted protein [Cloeon dipterum]
MLQNRYKTMNGQTGVSAAAAADGLRRTPEPLEVASSAAAPPPRRSVSVNHLARQLQSHTRVSPQVMVTPSKQFNHNNNRPFSYLSPQVTEHLVAGAASDEDEGLGIDAAYKPRQVSFSNKYRQVLFNEDDYPKARYEDDLPVRNGYEEDYSKKRYDDEYPKKRYDDDLPKKRLDEELTPKKRYDDVPLKKYEFGQRVSSSSGGGGGGRYTSDHSSRDVVDSGIENDHPKYRTRTSERTSSRVSERTPSKVSTLRRESAGRESPAMPSARLVQQASKGGSPRRRSLSILDEQEAMENDRDNNNRTKTLETKEKKKRKLRLKNFFIRDKNKNNSSNEEQKEVKTSTLKRAIIRTKSSHDPSDTDQASCDELKPLPQQPARSSSSSQQQHQQRRPVKRSSSMHATHAPPPAPSSRRAASRSGSSVLDAPKLSWFKTVDRFTFRTNKNNNNNTKGNEVHVQRRHRRAYDDTDPESAPEPATTLERRHFKPRQKPSSGSSSGGPSGARRGVQQRQNRLLANSSEESENDPKPMYLHNAAVGDIPGRFGPRRTVSREELAAAAHKPTRNLSRSFSVLAPWRPSRYQGNPEIYYQNEGSERFLTKPPRGPNRMTASIESLGGSGSSLERGRTPKYKSRTNVNGL